MTQGLRPKVRTFNMNDNASPMDNNEEVETLEVDVHETHLKRFATIHNYVKEILLFTIAVLELTALILEYQHGHFTSE